MLGHGHAPRTDIAGNINFALGHGVGTSVADIAVHHNLSAGIEPAHVVGGRPEDLDAGIGKSHGSDPLSGLADDFDINRFIAGPPQPSPNAVLAESLDLQSPVSVFHRRLNLLFYNPGVDPLSGDSAGYPVNGCAAFYFSVRHGCSRSL